MKTLGEYTTWDIVIACEGMLIRSEGSKHEYRIMSLSKLIELSKVNHFEIYHLEKDGETVSAFAYLERNDNIPVIVEDSEYSRWGRVDETFHPEIQEEDRKQLEYRLNYYLNYYSRPTIKISRLDAIEIL